MSLRFRGGRFRSAPAPAPAPAPSTFYKIVGYVEAEPALEPESSSTKLETILEVESSPEVTNAPTETGLVPEDPATESTGGVGL